MSFIWPTMLVFLIFVPLLVIGYVVLGQRRRRLVESYGSFGLLQNSARQGVGARRHIPPAIFLVGITLLLFALARPQAVVSLPRIEGKVILAFDVSGSMAATDLKPTRMEAAKVAATDFVQKLPTTVQVGVVAFSDSGLSVQAPTNSQDAILAAINRLSPQRGTSLANGIQASLAAIVASPADNNTRLYTNITPMPTPSPTPMPRGTYSNAVIVLLTDGENNENPDPLAAAQAAADRGVRIYTVGIGSAEGTTLTVNGFTVHTQLNEPLLQQISQITNGTYYNAANEQDLLNIYDNLDPQLVIKPVKMEITSIFAGASILILLVGGLFSLTWFSRLP